MELKTGLEPATVCLRCRCSAIELLQHWVLTLYQEFTQSKVLYETYILCYNCMVGDSMNELDYGNVLHNFTENPLSLVLLLAMIFVVLIFLVSKTLRKSGLFLLLITFLIDRIIRILPINLYSLYPNLVLVIMAMYFVGMFFFFLKVFNKIFHKDKNVEDLSEEKREKSKIRKFFAYTGSLPLLIMMVVNLLNSSLLILPRSLVSNLTSLSFLFMVFITLIHTYKYIDKKEISDDFDHMKFRDLKKDTEKDHFENQAPNHNKGRKILRTKIEEEKTDLKAKEPKEEARRSVLKDIKYQDEVKYSFDKKEAPKYEDKVKNESYYDLLSQVTRGFDAPMNKTVLSIKNLVDGESLSYVSENCIAKIIEDEEYKVDLEFKDFNEYDYGKFIDILMAYSKDKKSYKFELELMPKENPYSKIVFYDPSEIFDSVKMFSKSFQGKTISMNFPKYKINFVTSN